MHTTAIEQARRATPLKWPILLSSAGLLVWGYAALPAGADLDAEVGHMLRATARVAFLFFMLAYVARPLVRLFGVGRVLLVHRRYLGLSMALAHTVHFGYVAAFIVLLGAPVEVLTYVFGGLAFVLMWAMAATSNDASMRLLGRKWKILHTFGLHYLWLVFMQTLIGNALGDDPYYFYTLLSLAGFAGLILRVLAHRSARRG